VPEMPDLIELSASLVAAYVAHNHLSAAELPGLLRSVHGALTGLREASAATGAPAGAAEALTPAQIRKSITPDALISFIDGKPYKTLKRHLTIHSLDPVTYRTRFGLPSDYPMVCASYSAKRSQLAKAIRLGVPGGQAQRNAAE
jgi:predicted transcriptional regulator